MSGIRRPLRGRRAFQVRRHCTGALVLLALAGVGLLAHRAAGAPPETKRVAIFALQADGLSDAEVEQLPEVIGPMIASHPGFEVVSSAETQRALNDGEIQQPGCALSEACLAQVGRALHADLVLSGSLARGPRGLVLSFALGKAEGGQEPTRATESMRLRKNLRLNVTLCLNRLFGWDGRPEAILAAGPRRVAIFEVLEDSDFAPEAAQVPDLIGRIVASHAGFEVISSSELSRALQAAENDRPGCTLSEACRRRVGHDLRADLVLSASFERHGPGYLLSVAVDGSDGARRTSESMRHLTSLALNVTLCLNHLFGWDDRPGAFAAAGTVEATVSPAAMKAVAPEPGGAQATAKPETPTLPTPPGAEAPAANSTTALGASVAAPVAIAPATSGAMAPSDADASLPTAGFVSDRRSESPPSIMPGAFDVLFGSGSTSQHWLLLDSTGVPIDRLPCRRVVPPESGWKLRLAADQSEQPVTLELPSSFDFAAGHALLVLPRKPFLPELTVPGSRERVLLWLFGLGGVAALEVVGGLYAGGGAAIGSSTTAPNPAVAVPLMVGGGALLATVIALQAVARPGLEVTSLPGG